MTATGFKKKYQDWRATAWVFIVYFVAMFVTVVIEINHTNNVEADVAVPVVLRLGTLVGDML